MRIAFLISTVHDIGGTAGAVVTQANALADHHDVEILSVFPPTSGHHFPIDPRVRVRDLVDASLDHLTGREPLLIPRGTDPHVDARTDAALETALPALAADVLVTVTPAMLAYAVQLAPARTAVVHQEHRSSASRASSRDLLLDQARRADVVAMLTEPMAHWLRQELGTAAPEVVVVPNALAPGFRPRSPLTEPVIVGVGRLATEKQWPTLLRAFASVADQIPEWRVRIFGEGPARFEAMGAVRRLGLWDRVELPGPTSDMTAEWARASMSALTSQPGEGFPLVIQEAMAAGVPVVAYDMPTGPRDQIDQGVDGLLVTQRSEAGLAAAILRLATDPAERLRLGAAARAKAATWDSASVTARWLQVFDDVTRRRASTGGRSSTVLTTRGTPPALPLVGVAPPGHEAVGVTPAQARHETLRAATRLAAAVTDAWFVVPPLRELPATVVLPMEARAAFVTALTGDGALPAYVSVHDPDHHGWPSRRGRPDEMLAPLLRARTGRLELEPWPLVVSPYNADRTRGALLGRGCGVAVEFWEDGPDGALHSPGRAAWTTSVPRGASTVTTRVHDLDVPTLPVMAGPTVYDCRFPVDVVYTWVDGADPAWEARRVARLAQVTGSDPTMLTRAASGRARYVDRGELRYSMRGLHLFAPWVRTVHLVTDGQVPAWLDTAHPSINVVDHRDLLPPDALPTFNSHAIEAAVHRIDGLAEHFVYLNDDVFLGTPTRPDAFFTPAGTAAVFPSPTVVGLPGQGTLPWALAADNNRRLLAEAFGATTVNTMLHTPHAHRVSTLAEVAERFAPEVGATMRSPFRSAQDVSMLSSLAQHYGLLTGRAHIGTTDFAFVDITDTVVRRKLKDLLHRERDGFCLGDGHDFARDPEMVAEMVTEFLELYFPLAAPWER